MITIRKTTTPKEKPTTAHLGFGKYFTDHMFLLNYTTDRGWHDARVVPYEPLPIDPGASALHYGQALFEGMKAFKQKNGDVVLFRPEFNWERLCSGADRLCMKAPPKEAMLEGIRELVKVDRDWIPTDKGSSLYIRPTLIGTEGFLGVRPAEEYLFFVICSPVSSYYAEGAAPIKIWVEDKYLRAAPGGLGATKAGANYAASLKAALEAKGKGYAQVLWLDVTRQFVEEVGTMNVFFVFENEVVTPQLNGSILAGGVRDSVIQILRKQGHKVNERRLPINEIIEGANNGKLKEVFGTGTAAVVSPVGELASSHYKLAINHGKVGPVAEETYRILNGLQFGEVADEYGWLQKL